jgi:hypothetical protein
MNTPSLDKKDAILDSFLKAVKQTVQGKAPDARRVNFQE